MRVRTLVAGITLAMFTTVLGAPAALAAQPDPPPVQPDDTNENDNAVAPDPNANQPAQVQPAAVPPEATVSVSPDAVEKGQTFGITATCTEDGEPALAASGADLTGTTGTVTAEPGETVTVTLTCTNQDGVDEAEDSFKVLASPAAAQQKAAAVGPADLDVSPNESRRGEDFDIAITCPAGVNPTTLTANPGVVSFDGNLEGGTVNNNAPEGDVLITLTCPDNSTDTDTLKVLDDKDAYLDLDPNDGYREDKIEVEAYCPGTDEAKLNSPVLDDVTLKRDGDNILRGHTRVEDDAKYGDSFGEVLCKGGERPKDDFYVLEHRKADLDLDPAFGKRGDEIKVYVICDFTVGKLESDILEDIEVKRDDDDAKWRYRGKTKVVSDAKAGEHTVKIKCGDDYLKEEFFVIVDGDAKGGTQVTVYPKGAPETGGGPVGSGPAGALSLVGLTGFATLPVRRTVRR